MSNGKSAGNGFFECTSIVCRRPPSNPRVPAKQKIVMELRSKAGRLVILDVEDLIPGAAGYTLEVSSPGMDRALTKSEHFTRFRGRLAKITTSEPVGQSKFFEGRLAGFADGNVRLTLKGKEERVVEIPLHMIRKANLVVEF
jgi:ribosome maturation factor RimP